jgi:hypothetical protein
VNWGDRNPVRLDGAKERVMGFEAIANPAVSKGNQPIPAAGAAKASVAVSPPMPADADLHLIVDAWPTLPEPIRAGILAMVKAAKPESIAH